MTTSNTLTALECQRKQCLELAAMSPRQRLLADEACGDELLSLLEERLEAANRLVLLCRRAAAIGRDPSVEPLTARQRAAARAALAECRELLEQALASDRQDLLAMHRKRAGLNRETGRPPAVDRVNQGYAAAAYRSAGVGVLGVHP